jgi:hypothetical protein
MWHNEERQKSTATALPWAVGTHVLLVLDALHTVTPAMIHKWQVVAAVVHVYNSLKRTDPTFHSVPVIEAIAQVLQKDLFPGSIPPKAEFSKAFQQYGQGRPHRVGKLWERKHGGGEYHGPSVVHQQVQPLEGNTGEIAQGESRFDNFLHILRDNSPSPADLPPIADWTVVEMTRQMQQTANREFSSDLPIARVNFIAIFLICAEVLGKFRNCEDLPFTMDRAVRIVERATQALKDLDVKGVAAVSDGPAAGLKGTLQSFARRSRDEIFWSQL